MKIQIQISNTVDVKEWERHLSKSLAATTYQVPAWQEMFKEVYGSKPIFITASDSSGKILGQLAGIIHKKWFWRDANILSKAVGSQLGLGTIIHWFYGPIIHDKSNQNAIISEILSAVERVATENNVLMIRGISPPLEDGISNTSFQKQGYHLESGATFILDLHQKIDDLYNSLKKDVRYYIRKSENLDLKFEIANERKTFSEFKDLKLATLKKEGGRRIVDDPTFYDKHWQLLFKGGYEQLLSARKGHEYLGGIQILIFNGNVIQHALTNSPKIELVGTFLTWNLIKWASSMKFGTFDFAGVNPKPKTEKEKGIYYYASKWGGKKREYTRYTKILNRNKYYLSSGLKNPSKILRKKIEIYL